jgi:hypothetical protein
VRDRRHDETGRSAGRLRRARHAKIEGPFVPHLAEMIASPAWRALSLGGRRILDRLEIEHVNHGGVENGRLPVTFDDFARAGVRRQSVRDGLREVEALGFVEIVERGSAGNAGYRRPHVFRLTYLPTASAPPTHDWRRIKTETEAKAVTGTAKPISHAPEARWRVA